VVAVSTNPARLIPSDLEDVPASARLVYLALRAAEDPLTVEDLADATAVSETTIPKSLRELDAAGINIESTRTLSDPRVNSYILSDEESGDGSEGSPGGERPNHRGT